MRDAERRHARAGYTRRTGVVLKPTLVLAQGTDGGVQSYKRRERAVSRRAGEMTRQEAKPWE